MGRFTIFIFSIYFFFILIYTKEYTIYNVQCIMNQKAKPFPQFCILHYEFCIF